MLPETTPDTDIAAAAIIATGLALDNKEEAGHGSCANCQQPVIGAYCHHCGQSTHIHRSLLHMAEELLHGLFHFETKAWRTLPALVVSPGQLTRDYINGKRTRFVSPLALYLFLLFLMFFVFSLTGTTLDGFQTKEETKVLSQKQKESLKKEIAELRAQEKQAQPGSEEARELQLEIEELGKELTASTASQAQSSTTKLTEPTTKEQSAATGLKELATELEKSAEKNTPTWLTTRLKHAAENPELVIYKMKSGASKFALLLPPLALPFLWLMFVFRRQFVMFDHAVFALYSLCFMACLMIVCSLLNTLDLGWLAIMLIIFVPPVHMYAQLKATYQLTRFESIWRTLFLIVIALISIALYMLSLLAASM
ncbi:DUF3667 domain-containing protein [Undibacterium rugosum]|uniref:DUF3667 domain-containing protein n=1 Tax=Undibacterium rugosum TaxID=2762291 RepID=A0A923KYP7_9BURK|nr:DUF3667 domain-containing protein [Undibacterium rugosum]MBC3934653.1 DUF3667 domain-containing protein [Undibacterium rugosum]MBR7779797.1 DUF3667 domain-containing protein [Undibacterium rugosum]